MARTFAARLRDLRLTKRLTQREVAVRLGIAPSTLGMYEAGKREPDNEILVAIAEVYETSVDYLLGLTGDPAPPSRDESGVIRRDYPLRARARALAARQTTGQNHLPRFCPDSHSTRGACPTPAYIGEAHRGASTYQENAYMASCNVHMCTV